MDAWHDCGVQVQQWVVCLEAHADSDTTWLQVNNLFRFHMAVELTKRARWLQVQNYLDETHGIQVNFSENHSRLQVVCLAVQQEWEGKRESK